MSPGHLFAAAHPDPEKERLCTISTTSWTSTPHIGPTPGLPGRSKASRRPRLWSKFSMSDTPRTRWVRRILSAPRIPPNPPDATGLVFWLACLPLWPLWFRWLCNLRCLCGCVVVVVVFVSLVVVVVGIFDRRSSSFSDGLGFVVVAGGRALRVRRHLGPHFTSFKGPFNSHFEDRGGPLRNCTSGSPKGVLMYNHDNETARFD